MKLVFSLLVFVFFSFGAMAYEEGTVNIAANQKVFYRYQKPDAGQPTIVLLNGLIYSLDNWNKYFEIMSNKGFGVLLIAYSTQPESLRYLSVEPYYSEMEYTVQGPKQVGISIQTLVDEVMEVIDDVGINKFHLFSLSYGSVVASELAVQNKERIHSLIFAAPAVLASHRYNAWGKSRHEWYESIGSSGDYYYDLEMYQSMFTLVSAGNYHFSDVKFMDFFHGVYQMGRCAKRFDLKDYASANLPPTHLFLASREDGALLEDQLRFWELMKRNPARGSFTMFEGGEHALPGVVPGAVAEITEKIIRGELVTGEQYKEAGGAAQTSSSSTKP